MTASPAVRRWLLLALVAVVVQEALTVYPDRGLGPHLLWGGISLLLLHRVSRGGDLARLALLAIAALGAGIFLTGIVLMGPGVDLSRVGPLSVAYLTQAAVMMVPAVRQWTRASPRTRPA